MGTNLEKVLDMLLDFETHADYWFSCIGYKGRALDELLAEVRTRLREINELQAHAESSDSEGKEK